MTKRTKRKHDPFDNDAIRYDDEQAEACAEIADLQARAVHFEKVAREGHGCTFEDPPLHAAYVDCIGSDCDWRVYIALAGALAGTVGPFVNDARAAHAEHVEELLRWPR